LARELLRRVFKIAYNYNGIEVTNSETFRFLKNNIVIMAEFIEIEIEVYQN